MEIALHYGQLILTLAHPITQKMKDAHPNDDFCDEDFYKITLGALIDFFNDNIPNLFIGKDKNEIDAFAKLFASKFPLV